MSTYLKTNMNSFTAQQKYIILKTMLLRFYVTCRFELM